MQKEKWNFHNSYSKLPKIFFSKQYPTSVRNPNLVIFNHSLADFLGAPLDLEVFAGNEVPKDAEPLALAYAGHQFGHFTMLGDGRAILLGEHVTNSEKRFDVQLKGSGQTRYSRNGDGRAVLSPMLREYIISETMSALGIPTTRSLAVVTTGETVMREKKHQGAILTRIASSHIRVGTFEYISHVGTTEDIRCLADYTIERHFPDISNSVNKYFFMLKEIIKCQASLIAKWQLVGFIHGVMNTDNMAISGETIDYGPCAFMDTYHPDTVFSSIDKYGRYCFKNQPVMAEWNLARLAEALVPILHDDENEAVILGQEAVTNFRDLYQSYWLSGMRAKLGLFNEEAEDKLLIEDLLQQMQQFKADYTNTFRALTLDQREEMELFFTPRFHQWFEQWQERLKRQGKTKGEIRTLMKQHNPAIIARNHQVEDALSAAEKGDLSVMNKLLCALNNPFEYSSLQEKYSNQAESASYHYQTFCGT